ncbi:MAG: FHA domain-containing protein [bacterium]|nr:FHA domain-containing protein [bacterium]
MIKVPTIIMQLVHIQGPMKGQIQEFSSDTIFIGRHSSCDVQFPKDLDILSRKHARIIREGNRFKLIDQSTNGTFINGKQVQEAYLKVGDILLFADGGPKVSFLTKPGESPAQLPQADEIQAVQTARPQPFESQTPTTPLSLPPERPAAEIKIERTQMPLIIQYGPTIRTFKELPVTVGRNPACDFSIDHPGLLDQHVQFFFSRGQYGIKDLTGKNQVTLNGSPVNFQAQLHPECRVSLSSSGPSFRFLGAGRLAEIEESPPREANVPTPAPEAPSIPEKTASKPPKTAKGLINKLFKS